MVVNGTLDQVVPYLVWKANHVVRDLDQPVADPITLFEVGLDLLFLIGVFEKLASGERLDAVCPVAVDLGLECRRRNQP